MAEGLAPAAEEEACPRFLLGSSSDGAGACGGRSREGAASLPSFFFFFVTAAGGARGAMVKSIVLWPKLAHQNLR